MNLATKMYSKPFLYTNCSHALFIIWRATWIIISAWIKTLNHFGFIVFHTSFLLCPESYSAVKSLTVPLNPLPSCWRSTVIHYLTVDGSSELHRPRSCWLSPHRITCGYRVSALSSRTLPRQQPVPRVTKKSIMIILSRVIVDLY